MFSPADSATREQALAIAVRMVDNLKGKTIDYTPTDLPSTTAPPSGGGVTVGPLSTDKTTYTVGETITVTVNGVTQEMVDDTAYVAIYEVGADHWGEGQTRYPKVGTNTLTLTAPAFIGMYEIRFYNAVVFSDRGSALVATIPFSVVDKDKPVDNNSTLPNDGGSIVGMWRSERYYSGSNGTVGVVFFNADGTYQVIQYHHDRFIGERGNYRLNGSNLEVYNLEIWSKHDDALSWQYFSEDLTKIRDIISSGTRSEVLAIIEPTHSIWQHYTGFLTASSDWNEYATNSWNEAIEWIDATTIDYPNGLHYPLKLVS